MTVNAWLINMPTRVKGFSCRNEDDSYSVFINSRLTREEQEKAYAHEIKHIESGDFDVFGHVQTIELLAHI